MGAKLRKAEIDLSTIGTGVITFGAWTFIKFILSYSLAGDKLTKSLPQENKAVTLTIIYTVIALSLLIRCYIGFSARGESKGKKKHIFYLICAGVILFFSVLIILFEVIMLIFLMDGILTLVINIIVDLTSAVLLLELIINSVRVRRYRKTEVQDER